MNLVKPSFEILTIMAYDEFDDPTGPLRMIEEAGRTCYKSESDLTPDTAKKFVQKLNKLGHLSVIEHSAMTVKFIIDRGVSHELVRHRLCAFSQESTRYCNYKGGVTFIIPPWLSDEHDRIGSIDIDTPPDPAYVTWVMSMEDAERSYLNLLSNNWSPQQARSVLPNSTKTEIVVTANFREWQHIFKLRCSKAAHPQMREIMIPLHQECNRILPEIFDCIEY